jgi:hypothetical protein
MPVHPGEPVSGIHFSPLQEVSALQQSSTQQWRMTGPSSGVSSSFWPLAFRIITPTNARRLALLIESLIFWYLASNKTILWELHEALVIEGSHSHSSGKEHSTAVFDIL